MHPLPCVNFRSVIRSNYPVSEFLFVGVWKFGIHVSMHIACYAMTSHEINRTHLCCIDAYIVCIDVHILYFVFSNSPYVHSRSPFSCSFLHFRTLLLSTWTKSPPSSFLLQHQSQPVRSWLHEGKNLSVFHFCLLWRATNIRKIFSDNLTKTKIFPQNHSI